MQKIRRKLRDLSIDLDSASNPRRASARKIIEETLYLLGTAYNYEPTDEELFKMLAERVKEVNKRTDGLSDIIRAFKI